MEIQRTNRDYFEKQHAIKFKKILNYWGYLRRYIPTKIEPRKQGVVCGRTWKEEKKGKIL